MIKVKICGLKTPEEIRIVNKIQPDYAGFIFAPTKRLVSLEKAKELKALLRPTIKTVGVFVNESIEKILSYEQAGVMDVVQLHGDEDLEYMSLLKKKSKLPIIKAFRIKDEESFEQQAKTMASPLIDYILLDTYHSSQYGGTGKSFDWRLLEKVKRPYFLAGGIGEDNAKEAAALGPYALDISSKVETNGLKDENKLIRLFESLAEYRK